MIASPYRSNEASAPHDTRFRVIVNEGSTGMSVFRKQHSSEMDVELGTYRWFWVARLAIWWWMMRRILCVASVYRGEKLVCKYEDTYGGVVKWIPIEDGAVQ